MNKVFLLPLSKLKPHEQILPARVLEVLEMIKKAGKFTQPILVEKKSLVILDGHHRVEAMKKMGYKTIPAQLVNYSEIEVSLRHKNLSSKIIKEMVLYLASRNIVLPSKTTKHGLKLITSKLRKGTTCLRRQNFRNSNIRIVS